MRGGGAPGGPCAPTGLLGLAQGGPRRLGHARAVAAAAAAGASTARVAGCDGEHEHGVKEMAAKLRAVLVGSEETGSGENSCGGRSFHGGHGGHARRLQALERRRASEGSE